MRIDVLTAFPGILHGPLNESILKQARKRVDLTITVHDLREFSIDKHHTIDDTPYGGGPGMVLKAEPLFNALEHIFLGDPGWGERRVIYPSPQGHLFNQKIAQKLSECEHLVFICGHYKAVDQRVIDTWVTDEISVGDYVLSGGEIPTLLMIDGIVRLIPGVINDLQSARSDSFQDGLLDCPYYTRPEEFQGMRVPEILLSGNHAKIAEWRERERLKRTRERRPDLYRQHMKKGKKKRPG